MRFGPLLSVRRTSITSNASRCRTNRFTAKTPFGIRVQLRLNQRQNPTKARARWIADDDETPTITWPEPMSWSPPMKGPGCARGEMFNTADLIQDQLHADGHRVWGFVVYRCTYGDDAAWQTFLERIDASIRDSLEYYHGLDLLEEDRFKFTVLEDASNFDGASVQLVREHFKEWGKNAVLVEQGTSEEIEARRVKPEPIPIDDTWPKANINMELWTRMMGDVKEAPRREPRPPFRIASSKNAYGHHCPAVRYTFCIQIDDLCRPSPIR